MKRKNRLICEFTEFNIQRLNPDSARASIHVDDPKLSIDAFDKHQDKIRLAMSRINDILFNLKGTSAYSTLRGKLALQEQDIQSIKIQRIVKTDNIGYDVYINFMIADENYYGVIKNILINPDFKSEVFQDYDLYQAKEWVIKTKGIVIKTIKLWLKPEKGIYKLINNEVICYSTETGKLHRIERGTQIELIKSLNDKLIIKVENDICHLIGDNHIYFNYWFEKID